jgi:hypothetical protein
MRYYQTYELQTIKFNLHKAEDLPVTSFRLAIIVKTFKFYKTNPRLFSHALVSTIFSSANSTKRAISTRRSITTDTPLIVTPKLFEVDYL